MSLQNKLQAKMPQIEAIFSNKENAFKVEVLNPGVFSISRNGIPAILTPQQIQGLEVYLNLSLIFNEDDFKKETTITQAE